MGGKILRRAEKSIIEKIKKAKRIIFFLDYDGTLTSIKKKPSLASIDENAKRSLKKLAKTSWSKVFIISGRSLKDIKDLVGIKSLYYIGNHGIELNGPKLKYINRTAQNLKPVIQKSYRLLKARLKIKGLLLENKNYTLSVHYRLVDSGKVPALKKIFKGTIKDLRKKGKIKITEGKKVLELRPNIKWDKGKIVSWVLGKIKREDTLPISIGDDKTDEDAFRALGKKGISILVSKTKRKTAAQYRLSSPKDVVKFLNVILDKK